MATNYFKVVCAKVGVCKMHFAGMVLLLMFSFALSCNDSKRHALWVSNGNYVCCDSFNERDFLFLSTCYSKDSTILNGPQIFYNNKMGGVVMWKWYRGFVNNERNKQDTIPVFGAYYDEYGKFKEFKGNPFIGFSFSDNKFFIEMVSPPNTNKVLLIIDSFNNKLFKSNAYQPVENDTTCIVSLSIDSFVTSHKYRACYQISDVGKVLCEYSVPFELE